MKVYYDEEVDSVYLELGTETPDGVIEMGEGIHADTTETGKLVGLEILDASKKMDISTIMNYSIQLSPSLFPKQAQAIGAN